MTVSHDIPGLAEEMLEAQLAPTAEHRLLLEPVLRLLATGAPVGVDELARASGLAAEKVAPALDAWPGIERDAAGRVVGFGLTLEPTEHVVEIDGARLYAWCALDTLIFPVLLDRTARVRSTSPAGGPPVELTVDAGGAHGVTPPDAVVSLVAPTGALGDDVRGRFCCFVHFFPSEQAAQRFTERVEGAFVVSLQEAAELGRLLAQRMFGPVREPDRR